MNAALKQLSACEAVSDISQERPPEGSGSSDDQSDDDTDCQMAMRNVRRHQDEVVHRTIAADPKVKGLRGCFLTETPEQHTSVAGRSSDDTRTFAMMLHA